MKNNKQTAFNLNIKLLFMVACLLAILTGFGVNWIVKANHPPYVKEDTFVFGLGETIPTMSDYYLSYTNNFEDVQFDEALFTMQEVGEYDVEVIYGDMPYTLHIKIEDQDEPVITFLDGEPIQLYRIEGKLQTDNLFTITDASQVHIDKITPSLDDIQNGVQEICVVASDANKNTANACKTVNIQISDYTIVLQDDYASVEELVASFIKSYNLNENTFGFFYYSPTDDETYVYNGNGIFTAASTIKVPLNMLYYDKIAKGEISASTSYTLYSSDVEGGDGNTLSEYNIGQAVPLSYLQAECIINSDNTATNALIRNIGGFSKFRTLLPQYSDEVMPNIFYTQNVITPNYMLDVMTNLYNHQDHYAELIANMKNAAYGNYLQASTDVFAIAQKYGLFDDFLHTVGIVYTPQPYIVGIYTSDVGNADNLIPELNAQLIAYQLQK